MRYVAQHYVTRDNFFSHNVEMNNKGILFISMQLILPITFNYVRRYSAVNNFWRLHQTYGLGKKNLKNPSCMQ